MAGRALRKLDAFINLDCPLGTMTGGIVLTFDSSSKQRGLSSILRLPGYSVQKDEHQVQTGPNRPSRLLGRPPR